MADELDLVERLRACSRDVDAAHFCGEDSILRNDLDLCEVSDLLQKAADQLALKDKALREIEWGRRDENGNFAWDDFASCYCCHFTKSEGHHKSCLIAKAMEV